MSWASERYQSFHTGVARLVSSCEQLIFLSVSSPTCPAGKIFASDTDEAPVHTHTYFENWMRANTIKMTPSTTI
jgi:hypothetical protein